MPHLQFGGRYWKIAGDDICPLLVCSATFRVFWSVALAVVFSLSINYLLQCKEGWIIALYLISSVIVSLCSVLCELFIIQKSFMGTIVDVAPRNGMGAYLTYHTGLWISQLCVAVLGSFILYFHQFPCASEFFSRTLSILVTVVVLSQFVDATCLVSCCGVCSHMSVSAIDEREEDYSTHVNKLQSSLKFLCKGAQLLSCNFFGGGHVGNDLEMVSKLIADLFHHDGFLDIVSSDVIAGIMLVRLQQRSRSERYRLSDVSIENEGDAIITSEAFHHQDVCSPLQGGLRKESNAIERELSASSEADVAIVDNLSHYAPYSLAVYTQYLFMYMHPCSGCCRMGFECSTFCMKGCPCVSKEISTFQGDNCFSTNQAAAIAAMRGRRKSSLVYFDMDNFNHPPFGVFIDYEKSTVVVSVRGTMSLEDCVRDLDIAPVEMDEVGQKFGFDGKGRYVHGGILKAAQAIGTTLLSGSILSDAFKRLKGDHCNNMNGNKKGDDRVVIVGHSLGASIAAVLAKLLQNSYPDVVCFGYGVFGAVVDPNTAKELQSFVYNVSHHNDMAPCLTFQAVLSLKREVLDAICRAKVNKMRVIRGAFREQITQIDELLYEKGDAPESEFSRMVDEFNRKVDMRIENMLKVHLCAPGRNFHLIKISRSKICCGAQEYKIYACDASLYETIRVAPTMFFDHFPNRYVNVLHSLSASWKTIGSHAIDIESGSDLV